MTLTALARGLAKVGRAGAGCRYGPRMALIENISDTARWVAAYRAMETERPDAHFRDPLARELAGERGFAIAKQMGGARSGWFLAERTVVFDRFIQRVIGEGVDAVLNLAAGLDTRPYRLELPAGLEWIEVDLPGILSYKESKLAGHAPRCQLKRVALDLSDVTARKKLFAEIAGRHRQVAVITEGLLVYLTEEIVRALASDLHAQPAIQHWMFDYNSEEILKFLQRQWGRFLAEGNAPMRFAPPGGLSFYESLGWTLEERVDALEEAHRLGRDMRGAWVFRLMLKLQPPKLRAQTKARFESGQALFRRA